MNLFIVILLFAISIGTGLGTFWQLKNYLTDEGKRNILFMSWLVILHLSWITNFILAMLKIILKA
jgi:hypothetical protein